MTRKQRCIFFSFIIFIFLCLYFFSVYAEKQVKDIYNSGLQMIESKNYDNYLKAKDIFESLIDYKDSSSKLKMVEDYLSIYDSAKEKIDDKNYEAAINELSKIPDFDNSEILLKKSKFDYANELYKNGQYDKAYQYYVQLDTYENSSEMAKDSLLRSINEKKEQVYLNAIEYLEKEDFSNALDLLNQIRDYDNVRPDIPQLIEKCNIEIQRKNQYDRANEYKNNESFIEAYKIFMELGDYRDSASLAKTCWLKFAPYSLSTTLFAGLHHSIALNNNGKILCTDMDYKFKTNSNDESENWNDIISISGFGTMVIGLKKDRSVVLEGHRDIDDKEKIDIIKADVSDWENIIQISTGQQHVAGLNEDGKILIRGLNIPGKSEIENWDNIIAIASGWADTIGLDSSGKVHYAGNSKNIDLEVLESWNDIKSIAFGGGVEDKAYAGRGHIVVLHEDGSVSAVGDNECGQCNVDGEEWKDIVAIAAGDWHTVGLKSNGDVVSTHPSNNVINKYDLYTGACNVYGNDWHDIISISAGCGITLGLKDNGEVVSVGYSDYHNSRPESYEWNNIKNYKIEWDIMPPLHTTSNSEE